MSAAPRYVLIAPFWHNPAHVGRQRIARFARALAQDGARVAVVAAGTTRSTKETAWGVELTIPDRWRLCREVGGLPPADHSRPPPRRVPWRRWLHYACLYPDLSVLWAHQAAADPGVRAACRGARWVISSSPPESAHVAGLRLARHLDADFVMDLRDGWLDEPLKPWLEHPGLRRTGEGLLERRLLRAAQRVLVTSSGWQQALVARLPELASKITVLLNACPLATAPLDSVVRPPRAPTAPLQLIYAGRLSGSSHRRTADHLLQPLLQAPASSAPSGLVLTVMGELLPGDTTWLEGRRSAFATRGWQLVAAPPIAREDALSRMHHADGLVLLSVSTRAIPSKLFDYLAAQRPILAIMPRQSAVAELTAGMPHVFPAYTEIEANNAASVQRFLAACAAADFACPIPDACTEAAHAAQLRAVLHA